MAKAKKPATSIAKSSAPATAKPAAKTAAARTSVARKVPRKPTASTSVANKPTSNKTKPVESPTKRTASTSTSDRRKATTKPVASKATATKAIASKVAAPPKPTPRSNQGTLEEIRQVLRDAGSTVRLNPIGGLELLCRAWRMRKNVRIAELAELLEMRVPETPAADLARELADRRVAALRPAVRSIADVSAGQAADRLKQVIWRDPRTSWLLLDFLAKPAWRSLPAVTCWKACLDEIVAIGDPRISEPLAELGDRYTAVIPTSVGVKVQKLITTAVKQLRDAPPWLELDDACNALCDQIAAQLGPEVATQQAKHKGARVAYERHADFLAAIFATPDDDGPRIVYADWLTEIGDARGELINLQLARAQGRTDETSRAREYEILEPRNAEKWLGAIAPVVFDNDQVYARGFTSYARLWKNKATLQHVADEPAWGTVETLAIAEWSGAGEQGQRALTQLMCGSRVVGLRALVNVPPELLITLADHEALVRIERLEAISIDGAGLGPQLARWLTAAARPRMVSFDTKQWGRDATDVAWLLELPRFDQLERILLARTQVSPASVVRFEATQLQRLQIHTLHDVMIELSRDPGGARFDRARVWRSVPPSWLEGPRGTLDGLDTLQAVEPWIRDRAVTLDVRTPFVPGSILERRPVRAPPTPTLLEQIGALARSVTVETGWHDVCTEMIWN